MLPVHVPAGDRANTAESTARIQASLCGRPARIAKPAPQMGGARSPGARVCAGGGRGRASARKDVHAMASAVAVSQVDPRARRPPDHVTALHPVGDVLRALRGTDGGGVVVRGVQRRPIHSAVEHSATLLARLVVPRRAVLRRGLTRAGDCRQERDIPCGELSLDRLHHRSSGRPRAAPCRYPLRSQRTSAPGRPRRRETCLPP